MKQFSLILVIGSSIYVLIRFAKVLFDIAYPEEDSWQNEYKFEIARFLAFTGTLFGSAWVFRPTDDSKSLAQVSELLDETLTTIGDIVGNNFQVDSIEYAAQFER